jgi:hypothetical protein
MPEYRHLLPTDPQYRRGAIAETDVPHDVARCRRFWHGFVRP